MEAKAIERVNGNKNNSRKLGFVICNKNKGKQFFIFSYE